MRRARLVLVPVALLLLLIAAAAPVRAQDPTPSASAAPTAAPSATPGASGASPAASAALDADCPEPTPSATPAPGQTFHPVLCPATPRGADPFSLISWIFTRVYQALFLGLVAFYALFGDIGLAIVALTIVIRILLIPLFK